MILTVDQTPLLQQLPQQIPLFHQTPHHLEVFAYTLVNTIEMDQWLQTKNMVHGAMAYFVKVVIWCIGIISIVEPQRHLRLHKPQLHPQHLQQSQCKQHNICTYFPWAICTYFLVTAHNVLNESHFPSTFWWEYISLKQNIDSFFEVLAGLFFQKYNNSLY